VTFNIGKGDSTLFDDLTVGDGTCLTATTFSSLPLIFFKTTDAIDGLQLRAEAILEVEQIAADRFWIHSAI
jgi:hypothetical protein